MENKKRPFSMDFWILAFITYLSGVALWPLWVALLVGGGIALDLSFNENKYDKLFRNCGLTNKDGQTPLVLKDGETKVISLPAGISQKQFEEKQLELEQALNCKIEYSFNKNLIMKCVPIELKTRYDYTYIPASSGTAINVGYSNDGLFELDISKDQHIIVAGETDSGKSSLLDIIVLGVLLGNGPIDLHLHDFQDITLPKYEQCKKVKSYGKSADDFSRLLDNMEQVCEERLKLFRSSKTYIEKLETWNKEYPHKALPYKFVIVDEAVALADYPELLEKFKKRVSMDRKTGIHYLLSLQRPDAEIIKGSIKANMSTRIAMKAVSPIDSEVILGGLRGAEKIKHQGRFLARHRGKLQEVQAFYIEPKNIHKLLKNNNCLKTSAELEAEQAKEQVIDRKKIIENFRRTYNNPYEVKK